MPPWEFCASQRHFALSWERWYIRKSSSCFTCTISTCVIAGRHCKGCVGHAEAVTYHILSKTTGEKMVQPLLWLCLSYMSINNKSRALKNKPHCFKKPPGEFVHWHHIFCFFLIFFLLLKLTSLSSCWTSISWQQSMVRNFPSSPEVCFNIWCLCMLMKRG